MSSPSKTEAKKDQLVGNVKENVGHAVGNQSLEAEGKTQNGAGAAQETAANVQGYVQGAANQVSGAVQGAYNSLTGNSTAEAGSKVQEKKGEAQKALNS
ncbi:hypothetical protein BDF21DRAFT_411588 [Thamnidium elegans]|uniref:CsbD-like domain-containing protein n=1 Tax=Thamnidium elegans TaxID=101142 RepID=A0A8H7SU26_9FUNG|nr:hypothetical protein INT48_002353 [Thamnidium elegans]KAI8090579.1 hypothetical protein BDF21DRAFT_411588 [Thamnidium elegans]